MAECNAAKVAHALTRSSEDYVVIVDVGARGYELWFRPENVDPFAMEMVLDLSQVSGDDASG